MNELDEYIGIVKAYKVAGKTVVLSVPTEVRRRLGLTSAGHFKVFVSVDNTIHYKPIKETIV